MLPPIRCYTCNDMVKFREYEELRVCKTSQCDALAQLNVHRYCCRRMYLGLQDGLTDILLNTVCTGFSDDLNKLELGVSTNRTINL